MTFHTYRDAEDYEIKGEAQGYNKARDTKGCTTIYSDYQRFTEMQ